MSSIWSQLRERKFAEWIIAYLAGAWLLLQVADFLRENFDWSPVFVRVLTVILGFGFLAVLVIAWFHGKRGAQRAPKVEMLALLLIAVTGGSIAWYVSTLEAEGEFAEPPAAEEGQTPVLLTAFDPATAAGSIAVLPFVNMTPDEQNDYLSDGITEDIIAELGKSASLRVISRTSTLRYKNTTKTIREIGTELGVGAILEGSVRVQGDQVRVVAQLIDVATDDHLWTETYDRDLQDIFAIQSDIAQEIASALNATLLPSALADAGRTSATDPDAYRMYSRGKALAASDLPSDRELAAVYLDSAIQRDPNFAEAWSELANLETPVVMTGMPGKAPPEQDGRVSAAAAAERALELNPRLSEARSAWALQRAMQDGDLERAEQSMREAVRSNPNSVQSRMRYAQVLAGRGQIDDAREQLHTVVMLDPLSPMVNAKAGEVAMTMGEYDEAEMYVRKAIQLDSTSVFPHITMAMLEKERGNMEAAIMEAEKAVLIAPSDPTAMSALGYILGLAGRTIDAEQIRDELQVKVEAGEAPRSAVAQIHFALGEFQEAVDQLKEGAAIPGERIITIMNPLIRKSLESLRQDSTYGAVIDSIFRYTARRPPRPPDTGRGGRRSSSGDGR